jgi:hypothetical protein
MIGYIPFCSRYRRIFIHPLRVSFNPRGPTVGACQWDVLANMGCPLLAACFLFSSMEEGRRAGGVVTGGMKNWGELAQASITFCLMHLSRIERAAMGGQTRHVHVTACGVIGSWSKGCRVMLSGDHADVCGPAGGYG